MAAASFGKLVLQRASGSWRSPPWPRPRWPTSWTLPPLPSQFPPRRGPPRGSWWPVLSPPSSLPSSAREAPKEESEASGGAGGAVVLEKKSKRQLKRERKQERKSPSHPCIEVGKSGDVDSCRYGASCHFSHDIDAYLAQKPADLEGMCPFTVLEQLCLYGLTCRILSTHKDSHVASEILQRETMR